MPDPERANLTAPGKRSKPIDILGILGRRAALVGLLGSLLGLVLAPLFWSTGGSSYSTSGMLAIDPGKEPTLTGRERETIPGNVGDYSRTLMNRMTSGDVLLAALQAVPTNEWPSFLNTRRAPEANQNRLAKALKVKEVARTYLMNVEMSGDLPTGLAPMLNAVLDAFVAKLRRELEQQNERRLTYLREERDQIVERITAERQRILALADTVPNKAFLHESYSVHLSKLEQIQRLYWESEANRAEREGDLRRSLADHQALQELSLQAYADERVADNFGINRIEQWTYEQLQSLRSTIDGLTTNNEDRTYVEMRMAAMNEYLLKYKGEVNDLTIRVLKEKRLYDLETEVIKASNALAAATSSSQVLRDRLEESRKEATATSEAIFNASDMSYSVGQLRERLTALNTRIDDCEMEAKAPLRVYIDRRAFVPTSPTSDSRSQLAVMGFLLAFGLVFGGILGFEILDDRIRGMAEVEAAIGGHAPEPIPFLKQGHLERILLDHPTSPAGHALRALAVRLHRERLKHGAHVIAFCGINPGAGNTSIALNTAQALSRLAPRVLLLALGRDGLAERSGLNPPPASITLLRDPEELESAIAPDTARGMDLATIKMGSEALPSKIGLTDLLTRLRNLYDVVLLDLGPVPEDDLALATLHSVDAAVFTAREDHSIYRDLRRALESAAAAGVPSLTVVLNGTRRPPAGWLHARIQKVLRPITQLHRRAGQEWRRRLHLKPKSIPGDEAS